MTLGQAMRKARKEAGLTIEELADKSGYSKATISQTETDKHIPKVTTILDLADVLGISVNEYTGHKVHNEERKVTVVEIPDDMIIFTKDKWLVINMESEDLGKAIKTCMNYLTHERR